MEVHWEEWQSHTDHGQEVAIELDWKIMFRAPHDDVRAYKQKRLWRNYITHMDHGLEATIELDWKSWSVRHIVRAYKLKRIVRIISAKPRSG